MLSRPYPGSPDALIAVAPEDGQDAVQIRGEGYFLLLLAILFFAVSINLRAERLPIKTYTTADGLANDHINRIRRDSRGFLWFCTDEGLSRFDGYTFTSYTTNDGLPNPHVNDLLETRTGVYWVATDGGVCRFNPTGVAREYNGTAPVAGDVGPGKVGRYTAKPMFRVYLPSEREEAQLVNTLAEDPSGAIWCGTNDGLYQMDETGNEVKFRFVDIGLPPADVRGGHQVNRIIVDRSGALWIAASGGLCRRKPDGRSERYIIPNKLLEPADAPPHDGEFYVSTLVEDSDGRLWAGTKYLGLCRLVADPDPSRPVTETLYSKQDGLPDNDVRSIFRSSDGKLLIGTGSGGLSELIPGAAGTRPQFLNHSTANGLSEAQIYDLVEDRDGNLWMGTYHSGVMRMAPHGFITYDQQDGFRAGLFNSIFETLTGQLCVTSGDNRRRFIECFDGKKFSTTSPNLRKRVIDFGTGSQQITFQDHAGEWWVATNQGLFRFPKAGGVGDLARTLPRRVYTMKDGLASDSIYRLYEDGRGDIWIATLARAESLARWVRSSGTIQRYPAATGVPPGNPGLATAFGEDASGSLWIGFNANAGMVRYRAGQFTRFTSGAGVPAGRINALYLDHAKRLWIASSEGGLSRLDSPRTDRPRFVTYTTAHGLSSNEVWSITEDRRGRIYLGTGRGVDRLDPVTGRIKRYTTADGLVQGDLRVALRDRHGDLWFVTNHGISRLAPEPDRPQAPPPIWITSLRIRGVRYPLSQLGETEVVGLVLKPDQNQVQIDFTSLNFGLGESPRYQYRLEGIQQDWSDPTDIRTVNYASLSPGNYRFTVRALNEEGVASPRLAVVEFRVTPPVWQRWWFLTAAALLVTLAVYRLYRFRVARLVELERLRTRIATDLHDDIGTSLSGMAFLSEAVKQQIEGTRPEAFEMASEVAMMARGLARALSDVVWSIDSRRDDLQNVITRIRQVASAVLEAQGITWSLEAPSAPEKVKLTPEQRHHLFLIFKEALNNIAQHAHSASARLTIKVEDDQLRAEIVDDGCGFSQAPPHAAREGEHEGNGLSNMKLRATQLGGRMNVVSAAGRGTRLELAIPLK